MKEIQLTKGYVALVDDDDFEQLSQYRWFARGRSGKIYAGRNYRKTDGRNGQIQMHNQILDVKGVDHKDGNGLNNQRSNLRPATQSQNSANNRSKKNRKMPGQYRGVYPSTRNKLRPWRAQIGINSHQIGLGYFVTEIEAAVAYDIAAKQYHGEFARLNFPNNVEENGHGS